MSYREFKKSLILDEKGKSPSYFTIDSFKMHSLKFSIKFLKEYSKKNYSDIRICFHPNLQHQLHAMIILQHKSNKYLPHKHPIVGDTILVCEGKLVAKIFDEKGIIIEENIIKKNNLFMMANNVYHCFDPLTKTVIYLELKPGPFEKFGTSIFPKWTTQK